ncbi:hypothetical protein VTJ49DRAFT_7219 [Mycothermus thermophilus]|uniref:DNA mismatch repair proteins mutS family domain-containing protein n=1 Tax=Humicola insolens TaxID=85995 RepID=A0ABR3VQC5_HUMIN
MTPSEVPYRRSSVHQAQPADPPMGLSQYQSEGGSIQHRAQQDRPGVPYQPSLRAPTIPAQATTLSVPPQGHANLLSLTPTTDTGSLSTPRDILSTQASSVSEYDLDSDEEPTGGGIGPDRNPQMHLPSHNGLEALENIRDPDEEDDTVICALSSSRTSDVVGMAVINLDVGHVDLTRFVNDQTFRHLTETLLRMPVFPNTFVVLRKVVDSDTKSSLVTHLEANFPSSKIVPLDRDHWNESNALKLIDRLAWKRDAKALRQNLKHNFYVSCAFSAVMAYVEHDSNLLIRDHSLRIRYRMPADTMGLDRVTITSLELFQNVRPANSASSTLFGLLNNTLTPQGRRLIRNEDLFTSLRASLKKLLHMDIERCIPWVPLRRDTRAPLPDNVGLIEGYYQFIAPSHKELKEAETEMNQILMIKAYLGGVKAVREALEGTECTGELFQWALEVCSQEKLAPIATLIESSIEPDAVYSKAPVDIRNNRLWAFKADPKSVPEGSRVKYREHTNEMHQYVEGLNRTFQENLGVAPELRLSNDNHYHLRFQWSDVERELAKQGGAGEEAGRASVGHWRPRMLGGVETVNGIRRKQHYDCQTLELIQRSSQIQRHADIVTAQSDKFVADLKGALLKHAETLLAVNEAMAVLDMVCSFAHVATTQNYVRPILFDLLVLKGARHPVMEVKRANFVPNDVYSGDSGARFVLVTGGNMSGKSTFLKMVALIQIMMQIGSFVPATYAAMPLCDTIYTRLSTEDKPESNMGTFAVEMTEMNMILRQASQSSLVIIDELGRGTSTVEGFSIALSIAEELIKRKPRVFFATHFTELARVLNITRQKNILVLHVGGDSTKEGNTTEISLPHRVASGPVKNEDYGLDLARRFFPDRVLKNAEDVARFLRDIKADTAAGPATCAAKRNKLILALPDLLRHADQSSMDTPALSSYVKRLQTEFTVRMSLADDAQKAGTNTDPEEAKDAITFPVIEHSSAEELELWNHKTEAAEQRVMGAGQGAKKQPHPIDDIYPYPHNRERLNGRETSTPTPAPSSQTLRGTPVNRSLLIEELRRNAATPTMSRFQTPSSLQSGLYDTSSSILDATSPVLTVTPAPMDMDMSMDEVLSNSHRQRLGDLERAVSISSGSTPTSVYGEDVEMPDAEYPVDSSDDAAVSERQPLEQFQPLREWYARMGQAQGSHCEPMEED